MARNLGVHAGGEDQEDGGEERASRHASPPILRPGPHRRQAPSLCLALLAAVCLACGDPPAPAPTSPSSVLLVTLDTTRADHLGCYGYPRDTSPRLDELAAEGTAHPPLVATSSWTLPTHASLFTGRQPSSHGAHYDPLGPLALTDGIRGGPGLRSYRVRGLPEGPPTLASLLAGAGYVTGAVVAGPWLKRIFGLGRGFASYDDAGVTSVDGLLAEEVTDRALAFLDTTGGRPFFLFLNYYDPHSPYQPPPGFRQAFLPTGTGAPEGVRRAALYDAEIRYTDHHLGRLFDALRERGLYASTWILVTADHGELLGEHDLLGHGKTLYEEELRVPFVEKLPAGLTAPDPGDALLQHVDLMPRILTGLGLEVPDAVQGSASPEAGRPALAELYPPAAFSSAGDFRMLLDGPDKFLWNSLGAHRLYDLEADPGEHDNLLAREPERAREMTQRLTELYSALPRPVAAEAGAEPVDEDTQSALRRLGYAE